MKIYTKSFYPFASFSVSLKYDEEIWRETRKTGLTKCPIIAFLIQTHTWVSP